MKRRFIIAAVSLMLLLAGCSPVLRHAMPTDPVAEDAVTVASYSAVSSDSSALSVSFRSVPNATEYRITATEGQDSSYGCPEESIVVSGTSGILRGIIPGVEYDITIEARNSLNEDKWIAVFSSSYTLPIAAPTPNHRPEMSFSTDKSKQSLSIAVSAASGIRYRISLSDGSTVDYSDIYAGEGENVSTFSVSPEGRYTAEVSYSFISVPETEFESSKHIATSREDIDLSTYSSSLEISESGGTFRISGIPDNAVTVYISTADEEYRSSDEAVNGSRAEFDASSFLSSLESGNFYAFVTLDDGRTLQSYDYIEYTEPFDPSVISVEALWQTAFISWNDDNAGIFEDIDVNIENTAGPDVPRNTSKKYSAEAVEGGIQIEGLDSDSSYTVSVTINAGSESYSFSKSFTTKSFAGTYRWNNPKVKSGKQSAFEVIVTEAPAGSAYQYHATVSEQDPSYNGETIRMLPIIEDSRYTGGHIDPDNPPEYLEASNAAYLWNYNKWSTMSAGIDWWQTPSGGITNVNFRDYVCVYTTTHAVGDNKTITSWTFREKDGKPEVVFHNEGTGLAEMGMYKNPSPSAGLGKWDFVLSRIGD